MSKRTKAAKKRTRGAHDTHVSPQEPRSAKKSHSGVGAGGADAALPALSSLSDIPTLEKLPLHEDQRAAYETCCNTLVSEGVDAAELACACVVRLDRAFPLVVSAAGLQRAEFSFRFGVVREPSCAVGDWVCLRRPAGHDMAVIEFVLPRQSDIARWRGNNRGKKQTLAANVDIVLVAQALSRRPVDIDRIVRSAVIAQDCGAACAVVLTKADRAGAALLAQDISLIREVLGDKICVAVTAAGARGADGRNAGGRGADDAGGADGAALEDDMARVCLEHRALWGIEGVRELVPAGIVGIVLGESGAGKSTLLNALLGKNLLEVGHVRAKDDAGRHTTVARRMVDLPQAGVVVDEPGLRSLPLVGHERGLKLVFPDVAEAATLCRFRDCTHTKEPGCAVHEQVYEGRIPEVRAEAYRRLAEEMRRSSDSLDPDVVL
ncbi:MAG: ribosome small subunit-dependent GTPase A [Atopobiaceae bacterium]|jgi:ribosome biogenesis GTPase